MEAFWPLISGHAESACEQPPMVTVPSFASGFWPTEQSVTTMAFELAAAERQIVMVIRKTASEFIFAKSK